MKNEEGLDEKLVIYIDVDSYSRNQEQQEANNYDDGDDESNPQHENNTQYSF